MNILLVEDNESIALGLLYSLNQQNYQVTIKDSYLSAQSYLNENPKITLAIIDISLPDGDGFTLYQNLIHEKQIPTIFLTAKDSEDDIVKGLELGAEDYITKPFSTRELIARINRIIQKNTQHPKSSIVSIQNIHFDMDKMEVYRNQELLSLSRLELKILHLLFTNINRVTTREEIIEKIWEWTGNDVNDNTVTVYLKRIREKLQTNMIITIKGIGYRIDEVRK